MGSTRQSSSEFLGVQLVEQQMEAAQAFVATEMGERFIEEARQRLESCFGEVGAPSLAFDSPLEAAFWIWWLAFTKTDYYVRSLSLRQHVPAQTPVSSFVIDFVVVPFRSLSDTSERHRYIDARWPLVGIELDGHAFHEKTREQVTIRNQRDRELQKAGWKIFHYSFSEFTSEPTGALIEVIDFVRACESRIVDQFYTEQRALKGDTPLPDYIEAGKKAFIEASDGNGETDL